jgi:hypothetical protein
MTGKNNHDGSEFYWWDSEKKRPRRYSGILAKPLPSPESPKFNVEFHERMAALYSWFGLQHGDTTGLLYFLLCSHVPGFQFDKSANSLGGIEHPNRLLRKLYEFRRGGRPRISGYDVIVPEAIRFYEEKEREEKEQGKTRISGPRKAQRFLEQKAACYEFFLRQYPEILNEAIADAADELGLSSDHRKVQNLRERKLSCMPRGNPYAELRATTLDRKVREARRR